MATTKTDLSQTAAGIADFLGSVKSMDDYQSLMKDVFKRVAERALQAEMTQHLGYDKHAVTGRNTGNSRNGVSRKTIIADDGYVEIDTPRDREGSFAPQFIGKHQRQISSFSDEIIELYGHGMSVRDIQSYLEKRYDVEVSTGFISTLTDQVLDDMRAWQQRVLSERYAVVYLDALVTSSRQNGIVAKRHLYVALGINMQGQKELLGLWGQATEGAKAWMSMLNELKNRGVNDILIVCVDGLKGFEEAINAVYPHTQVQQCIVHQVRHSLRFVPWKMRKAVAADLRAIYSAATEAAARLALDDFETKWGEVYPSITPSWRNNWTRLTLFFDYPPAIRKVIYTTNAVESLNASLQKVLKPKKSFMDDEAMMKVIYLNAHRIAGKWTMPVRDWGLALGQLAVTFGSDRVAI